MTGGRRERRCVRHELLRERVGAPSLNRFDAVPALRVKLKLKCR